MSRFFGGCKLWMQKNKGSLKYSKHVNIQSEQKDNANRQNGGTDMKKRFVLITVLLVLITVFCTTGTVMGMEKGNVKIDGKFYKKMEQDYVLQVREYLDDEGYNNSGVALTKVLYEGGNREYTLNIHHKRIEKLTGVEKEQLRQELMDFAITGEQNVVGMDCILVVFS